MVLVIKSESEIFETCFFDTYVSCSLTFVLYTSGNVQLFGLRDSRDSQNRGFGIPGSPETPETPNIPNFGGIGSPGVQTPTQIEGFGSLGSLDYKTPNTLKIWDIASLGSLGSPKP